MEIVARDSGCERQPASYAISFSDSKSGDGLTMPGAERSRSRRDGERTAREIAAHRKFFGSAAKPARTLGITAQPLRLLYSNLDPIVTLSASERAIVSWPYTLVRLSVWLSGWSTNTFAVL